MKKTISHSLVPFFAWRQCIRNKRNFTLTMIGVTISIALLIISITTNNYTLEKQIETTKQTTGDWHIAYLLEDESAKDNLKQINGIKEVYQCFYIPNIQDSKYSESFYFLGITDSNITNFIHLNQGQYPTNSSEIIVPDWFIHKYNINQLPAKMNLSGSEYSIVGTVDSDYNTTKDSVPLYMSLEKNQNLIPYGTATLPWGTDTSALNNTDINTSVLISLENNANLKQVISDIETNVQGIKRYKIHDIYSIYQNTDDTNNDSYPIFNGNLIGLQHISGSGTLETSGTYAAINRLNIIYICIIIALSAALIFTFLNTQKDALIHQFGILRSMGCTCGKVIAIQLLNIIFIYFISLPIGSILGYLLSGSLIGFDYLSITPIMIYGFIFNLICLLIPSLLISLFIIFKDPISSIKKQSTQKLIGKSQIKHSTMIKNKIPFAFYIKYAFRNILTHKMRFIYAALSITLLFCLFTVTMTQINLYYIKGDQKTKYNYDLAITISANAEQPEQKLLSELKDDPEIDEIMAPTGYLVEINHQGPLQQGSLITEVENNKFTDLYRQILSISQFPNFTENNWLDSGVLGCQDDELNYLEQHLIEGSIEPLIQNQPYVLIPKYLEQYQNTNIEMTTLEIGDKLTIKLAQDSENPSNPEFVKEKTFIIAGFIDINPFETFNGASNQLSIIMNTKQLQDLVYPEIGKIYIKTKPKHFDSVLSKIQSYIYSKDGYRIENPREDSFQIEMKKRESSNELRNTLIIIVATAIVILIGLCNLLVIQILLRRPEIKLLRIVGLSAGAIRSIFIIETLFFNLFGILLGIVLSIVIIKQISFDFLLKNLIFIPWGIWIAVALIIILICITCTILSLIFLEKSLKKQQ